MIIAFDVDGTLIDFNDKPREPIVALCRALQDLEDNSMIDVIIWSGGGQEYAKTVARRLGLETFNCFAKFGNSLPQVDIAIDDDNMVRGVDYLLKIAKVK